MFSEVVVVVLTVRAGDKALDRTLDAMIEAAVAKFKKRFGDDIASVEAVDAEGQHRGQAFVIRHSAKRAVRRIFELHT